MSILEEVIEDLGVARARYCTITIPLVILREEHIPVDTRIAMLEVVAPLAVPRARLAVILIIHVEPLLASEALIRGFRLALNAAFMGSAELNFLAVAPLVPYRFL